MTEYRTILEIKMRFKRFSFTFYALRSENSQHSHNNSRMIFFFN